MEMIWKLLSKHPGLPEIKNLRGHIDVAIHAKGGQTEYYVLGNEDTLDLLWKTDILE